MEDLKKLLAWLVEQDVRPLYLKLQDMPSDDRRFRKVILDYLKSRDRLYSILRDRIFK